MEDSEVIEGREARPGWGNLPIATLLRGLAFASLAIGLVVAMHVYIAIHLIQGARLTRIGASLAWIATWMLFLSLFAGFFARRLPRSLATRIHWFAYSWMGLFALLFVSVAATDLGSALVALTRGQPLAARWGPIEACVVLALALPAFSWGVFRALSPAKIERVSIAVEGLPPELEGYKIVQISDLHIGDTLGRRFSERLTQQVNSLAPDAVAITGDLADGSAAQIREEVAPLGKLKAVDGVFFVTGNHEYYNGLGGWLAEARQLGWKVLLNEHQVIRRGAASLVMAGVTDYNAGERVEEHASNPAAAFEGAPSGPPRILLAHQPRSAFKASGLGIDLQLSGHTHGGQFFPWKYFVRLQQPVLAGLAEIGGVRVYTHRGTGFWGPPVRLGAPPEIALLTLTAR